MNIVVMGAQWGDEGKGKIVDFLAPDASIIVRFSGGANAGHTIVLGSEKYALHLVPSGILYKGKIAILGTGMVIDPEALYSELENLESRGIDWQGRVLISDRAHIVLPSYRRVDSDTDKARKRPIGTTGRGIGIAYSKKAQRDGIRLADLSNSLLLDNLEDADRKWLEKWTPKLEGLKINLSAFLINAKGQNVLFEGAQGALLDIDTGTYPYVSSGMSCAAGAAAHGGIGPRAIDKVLGVFKAYSTRVGNGPFPSEFNHATQSALENYIRETGKEYGVTTGRPRRCGLLDLVALRYAVQVNSIDNLILTHLDIYDALEEFEACIGYAIDGSTTTDFPAGLHELESATPVTARFKGWQKPIGGVRCYEELPAQALAYIQYIEEFVGAPVSIISIGSDRTATLVRKNPWQ